jgi:hypothetical protein
LLDEHDLEPAPRGIAGDAGAVNAATYDSETKSAIRRDPGRLCLSRPMRKNDGTQFLSANRWMEHMMNLPLPRLPSSLR